MHRVMVIGVAGRGRSWASIVRAHPSFELAGFVDVNLQVLTERAEEFQVPLEGRHTDLRQALASGRYDVAAINTPNHLHYPVAKQVIEAGVHCLVEKPFTEELSHAQELVRLADAKRVVLQVAQNYRYKAICRFVAEFIRREKLGRLSGVEASFHRYRPPRFDHERKMPFPMLYLQAIHHIDWLISLLPSPVIDVVSRHRHAPWSEFVNPSVCHFILACEDGVLVSYRGSYESQGEQTPYEAFWRFEFERGDLLISDDSQVVQVTQRGEKKEALFTRTAEDRPSEMFLLDELDAAITRGIDPATSGRNNLKTLQTLFAIFGPTR